MVRYVVVMVCYGRVCSVVFSPGFCEGLSTVRSRVASSTCTCIYTKNEKHF